MVSEAAYLWKSTDQEVIRIISEVVGVWIRVRVLVHKKTGSMRWIRKWRWYVELTTFETPVKQLDHEPKGENEKLSAYDLEMKRLVSYWTINAPKWQIRNWIGYRPKPSMFKTNKNRDTKGKLHKPVNT